MDSVGKGLIYDPVSGEFVFDKGAAKIAAKIRGVWELLRLLSLLILVAGLGIWLGQ